MDNCVFKDYPKVPGSSHTHKKCLYHSSPRLSYDLTLPLKRSSMRQNILDTVEKRTESHLSGDGVERDNPLYEDPRDVIGVKPIKPPRKRNKEATMASPSHKDGRSLNKEQKRKLTKKYESLITTLIDKCEIAVKKKVISSNEYDLKVAIISMPSEEHVLILTEKDAQVMKLKEKLKTVLQYNRLFAEENDRLKGQHATLIKYVEECKSAIREERERSVELEKRSRELANRVKQFELPDRDLEATTAIPLVEVCMSCSNRQILLNQSRDQNARLQKDMLALKDVLYRLNVQLSRYQEKLRSGVQQLAVDNTDVHKPGKDLDSILTSLGAKATETVEDTYNMYSNKMSEELPSAKIVDVSGLLSAQALAPLFDAYQENLQEKDNLIQDYEQQFEIINKKSKNIVDENKTLHQKVIALDDELVRVRQSYKKLVMEKETADIEKTTLVERAERAETKLKEVYELYEDKISAMSRDYATVHREYYAARAALSAAPHTVPADMHERSLLHCKRLLDELKHHYNMENERKDSQMKKMGESLKSLEEKCTSMSKEYEDMKIQLQEAQRNVKLYKKAATIFRSRLRSHTHRHKKRTRTSRSNYQPDKLRDAMIALHNIKMEIKTVKTRASASLELLERRILEQQEYYTAAQRQATKELQHKDNVIRSLVVSDTLNQTETRRLIGIVSSSDQSSHSDKKSKLIPTHGGYYKENGKSK